MSPAIKVVGYKAWTWFANFLGRWSSPSSSQNVTRASVFERMT